MSKTVSEQLQGLVIKEIQDAYTKGEIRQTLDCKKEMLSCGFYEVDVSKVILDATRIEKAMPATSQYKSHPNNTHYVFHGTSTKGIKIYCKICSNYHHATGEFLHWKITSFRRLQLEDYLL